METLCLPEFLEGEEERSRAQEAHETYIQTVKQYKSNFKNKNGHIHGRE